MSIDPADGATFLDVILGLVGEENPGSITADV